MTLEAIEQAKKIGSDMVTLPSHTLHAFQPLDVAYFKPFKIAFKKERYASMVNNNYSKPDKITLVAWVDQTLVKKNIISRFKITGIWPLNSKAIDEKTTPSTLYTLINANIIGGGDGESNEEDDELSPMGRTFYNNQIDQHSYNIGTHM
jgi:hypothetical protein